MQLKHHHLHHHHHHDRKRSPEELLAHMSSKYHLRKAKVGVQLRNTGCMFQRVTTVVTCGTGFGWRNTIVTVLVLVSPTRPA
jgi:hypothetical protein